ncbi:hypothetical protein AEA09_05455 [Lysinibacillus contaminans]|uniref:IDEAL domain-containing protein n=1 Tax=Lysinibacillus contaminans TaxID=1293441 RepID=A0ABR5K008_9BACI|nr:hypothetical protein [Lysinibacillus contaminans]KOS68052.1 hypothetical protein AEA09_05455 [Lysinibacillus contaminans]
MKKHSNLQNADYFKTYLTLVMDHRELSLQEAVDFMIQSYFSNNVELYGVQSKQQFELAIQQLSA